MLTFEEISIILTRNEKEGLICRVIEDEINGINSINYKININEIPNNPNEYIYVYQIDGFRCLRVTIINSYLYISRDKNNNINGFLVYVSLDKNINQVKSLFTEIIPMEEIFRYKELFTRFTVKGERYKYKDDITQLILSSKPVGIDIYTKDGLCRLTSFDPISNSATISPLGNSDDIKIKASDIIMYHLYPAIKPGYLIYGEDFDVIGKIINDNELYYKLGGEYIEDMSSNEKKNICKAMGEVIVNVISGKMMMNY